MRLLPFLMLALLALPAHGADAVFGGFMRDAVTGNYARDGSYEKLGTPRVGLIQTGGLDLRLERTPVAAVLEAYGGEYHQDGGVEARDAWICYAIPSGYTVWFYSDRQTSGGNVSAVGMEARPADPAWGCTEPPPMSLAYMQIDMPGLNAHPTELDATFTPLTPDSEGRLGFASESPHPELPNAIIRQHYVYRIGPDGIVDAAAAVQTTVD
jgi:hypothetical protein